MVARGLFPQIWLLKLKVYVIQNIIGGFGHHKWFFVHKVFLKAQLSVCKYTCDIWRQVKSYRTEAHPQDATAIYKSNRLYTARHGLFTWCDSDKEFIFEWVQLISIGVFAKKNFCGSRCRYRVVWIGVKTC